MQDFISNRYQIISDFCNRFKSITWKSIWGIDLNCNSKSREEVWLNFKLLKYQEITTCPNCPLECNFNNPTFNILQYCSNNSQPSLFPPLN